MVSSQGNGFPSLSRRSLLGAALAAPLLSIAPRWVSGVGAQTPEEAGGTGVLDLAAIPPRGADVPDGFMTNSDSQYEQGPYFFIASTGEAVPGVRRYHQGYPNPSTTDENFIGFFLIVTEFASAEEAEASLLQLQDTEAIVAANPHFINATPLEPLGLSDGAEFLGSAVVDDSANGGQISQSVVTAFRIENLVIEISADNFLSPDVAENAATIAAAMATPVVGNEMLIDIARAAGEATATRTRAVLAGEPVSGVIYGFADDVLPIQETWPESWLIFEGYRDAGITFDGTLTSFDDSLVSGYLRALTVHSEPDKFDSPYVTVSITQLDSPETMASFMTALDGAIDDLQTAGPTPRGTPRTFTTAPEIPGADAVLAYFSRLPDATADDSAGIVFSMGDRFAQIDVQGLGAEESLAAATELALAQATCSTGGSCAAPPVPAGLAA